MSINAAKWTFFFSLCASRITSLFCSELCPAAMLEFSQAFSIPCTLQLLHPESSVLEAEEQNCEPSCNGSLKWNFCLQCDLRVLYSLPRGFMRFHNATINDFWILL